jgi:hypothetical protein
MGMCTLAVIASLIPFPMYPPSYPVMTRYRIIHPFFLQMCQGDKSVVIGFEGFYGYPA